MRACTALVSLGGVSQGGFVTNSLEVQFFFGQSLEEVDKKKALVCLAVYHHCREGGSGTVWVRVDFSGCTQLCFLAIASTDTCRTFCWSPGGPQQVGLQLGTNALDQGVAALLACSG